MVPRFMGMNWLAYLLMREAQLVLQDGLVVG
jgi:hypothetical protein